MKQRSRRTFGLALLLAAGTLAVGGTVYADEKEKNAKRRWPLLPR